jgi:hypothetical protein
LGNSHAFEEFVTGLWYRITPQGTIDMNQYIYFDPQNREIIFFGDQTQQVFHWRSSTLTRLGLFISSQNISVSTLRRSIDLELETLDSIRVRVIEGIRLRVLVTAPWDGSYRKASPLLSYTQKPLASEAHINARYSGAFGRIHFHPTGIYELEALETVRQGIYSFYMLDGKELLELRSTELRSMELRSTELRSQREIFLVEGDKNGTLNLHPVRLSVRGVERLPERALTLSLLQE